MKIRNSLLTLIVLLAGIQVLNAQVYTATLGFGKEDLAVRELHRNAITGNIGWNGLTGFGITYHYYLGKQLGTDFGIGIATTGVKFGGRFRYLFSEKNFSPFVSAGFMYGMGSNTEIDYNFDNNPFSIKISSSPFAQIAGGIEYMSNNGFMFSANIGYAILLKDSNYDVTKGNPTNDELRAMDIAISSGIVLEFTIGYAFGGK